MNAQFLTPTQKRNINGLQATAIYNKYTQKQLRRAHLLAIAKEQQYGVIRVHRQHNIRWLQGEAIRLLKKFL
jgi:hypothetical protein